MGINIPRPKERIRVGRYTGKMSGCRNRAVIGPQIGESNATDVCFYTLLQSNLCSIIWAEIQRAGRD